MVCDQRRGRPPHRSPHRGALRGLHARGDNGGGLRGRPVLVPKLVTGQCGLRKEYVLVRVDLAQLGGVDRSADGHDVRHVHLLGLLVRQAQRDSSMWNTNLSPT